LAGKDASDHMASKALTASSPERSSQSRSMSTAAFFGRGALANLISSAKSQSTNVVSEPAVTRRLPSREKK
jgi:hypothetical protein